MYTVPKHEWAPLFWAAFRTALFFSWAQKERRSIYRASAFRKVRGRRQIWHPSYRTFQILLVMLSMSMLEIMLCKFMYLCKWHWISSRNDNYFALLAFLGNILTSLMVVFQNVLLNDGTCGSARTGQGAIMAYSSSITESRHCAFSRSV